MHNMGTIAKYCFVCGAFIVDSLGLGVPFKKGQNTRFISLIQLFTFIVLKSRVCFAEFIFQTDLFT